MGYDNTNTGAMFKNEKKEEGSKQPDYRGNLDVNGLQYEIAGWIKEAKNSGKKFLSLRVKIKEEESSYSNSNNSGEDVPF